jgi:mycothiol synthase
MLNIRPYEAAHAPALTAGHNAIYPERPTTADAFHRHLMGIKRDGGRIWVCGERKSAVGYAAVIPVPGLDGIVELEGFINPAHQGQGLGGRLLTHLLRELEQGDTRQVSHAVEALDTAAARFLRLHRFYVEHEEWIMTLAGNRLTDLTQPSDVALPTGCHLQTYPRASAIRHFCSLYERTFGSRPWYQPYTPAEVATALERASDILFLVEGEAPIGFVWLRWPAADKGEIEPMGVLEPYQGQGFGRYLLRAGLQQLAQRGVSQVELGVWQQNQAAIRLYRRVGFKYSHSLFYLATDLKQ